MKSDPPFNFVIHTASPYHFNIQDSVKDFLEPAINGTTGIIKAVMAYAPTVKRVVLTSSFATIVNPWNHAKVYDETMWGPVTREQAMDPTGAYRGSKVGTVHHENRFHDMLYYQRNRSWPKRPRGNSSKHKNRSLIW